MLRFQRGDEAAFDELVRRNTGKIHALVFRFLGGRGQLEDLTQEVFLRVYRTAARYQPTAKFSTWLYRIVANLAFNVLRSQRRAYVRSLESAETDEGDGYHHEIADKRARSPADRLDSAELALHVARAVAQLPDNQRIAIVLNRYENKSYEEIAKVLGCSTMAVKSLLSRARANLREALSSHLQAL